jgi:thymidylate kinase
MLQTRIETLFRELEHAGVQWALLRQPPRMDKDAGDVDLLVAAADLQTAKRVLGQCGLVQLPGWSPGLHWVGYDLATNCWAWVHLVTDLSFGPYGLLQTHAEAGCLNRRQHKDGHVTLSPNDAFWVLLLHCLLDKGGIPHKHRAALKELGAEARPDGEPAEMIAAACPHAWSLARIKGLATECNWEELEQFAPALRVSWMQRQRIHNWQIIRKKISRRVDRLLSLSDRRGLSVALLGPDGAGKSTLIAGIRKSFIFPVRTVYMGLTGGFLPYADTLRVPILVVLGRLLIFWYRYLVAQYHRTLGRLVLFDRYIYDAEVPTPYPLNRLERVYRWIDGHAIPAPDLVLLLDAPGEVMYRRKGEYSPETLEQWRVHFLALRRHVNHLEVVDSTIPEDALRTAVINLIWCRYADRWRRE